MGIWLHTPHGQQFPPSSPTSRALTENSLHLLQPLPVRESTGANTRHGAALANIDRTGKATPGPALCSGLTVKSCPWTSRGAQAGRCQLRVGLTPVSGLVRPSRPIPVRATALSSTPPSPAAAPSCPGLGSGAGPRGPAGRGRMLWPRTSNTRSYPKRIEVSPAMPGSCQELNSSWDQTESAQP